MAAKSISRVVEFNGALDLRATLGPGVVSDSSMKRQEAWRAMRNPQGLASLHLRVDHDRVTAEGWGEGAEWALDQVPDLLGLHDDPTTFDPTHDFLKRLHRRYRGLRISRTGLVWPTLPEIILGQKVTTTEAGRSWNSLIRAFGEDAPGPRPIRIGPPASALAGLRYHDFHAHGVERKRAEIIISAAKRVNRLEEVTSMSVADAYQRMMAFRGIGIWTASLVLAEAIGDPDAIAIGDYHVKNTVSWALAGEPRGTDERMIELLEPYRGHRQRVVRLLHLGGIGAPKYGPRTTPRDIRRH